MLMAVTMKTYLVTKANLLSLARELYLLMSWDPTNLSLISSAELILSENSSHDDGGDDDHDKYDVDPFFLGCLKHRYVKLCELSVEAPGSNYWEATR